MADEPWLKYAKPADGPWTKYQVAVSAAPKPVDTRKDNGPPVALADEPGKEYGAILPFSRDIKTGKTELAFPEMIRGPVQLASKATQQMFGQRPLPQPKEALEEAAMGVGGDIQGALKQAPKAIEAGKAATEGEKVANLRLGAQEARQAGYVLPPAAAKKEVGEGTSILAAPAGTSNLDKLASTKNQRITNSLAARDIGLSPNTPLLPQNTQAVRQQAGKVWEEVKRTVPVIDQGADKQFQRDIEKIGGDTLLKEHYPKTSHDEEIAKIQSDLRHSGEVPIDGVLEKIKDFRSSATANFRATDDPTKIKLAFAQKEAADALEDLVERSVAHADRYYEKEFAKASKAESAANKELTQANQAVTVARAKLTQTRGNVYAENSARREMADAQQKAQQAQQRQMQARQASRDIQARLRAAQQDTRKGGLIDRLKQARQTIAKTYAIDAATNETTGDVSARRLAAVLDKGKVKLTGGLETIAKTGRAFPHATREPSTFGGQSEHSALDAFAALALAAHGHLAPAAAVAGRPLVRRLLLSERYQNRMIPTKKPQMGGMENMGNLSP